MVSVRIYSPDFPVVLKTDASKYAIQAVLAQRNQPVASESRKLSDRESLAPSYELELLGVVHALDRWKTVLGTKKIVRETATQQQNTR